MNGKLVWIELCPPPNLYAETAVPNMTVFRGKVFMEMITGKWWPWSNRISILLTRDAKNLLSIPLWPQQEVVICKAVRGFLPGTEPCCYLVSDLLLSGMWDNKWVPSRWRCLNDNKAITGCIILVNFGFPCCKLWVKSYLYLQFADRVSDDSSHLSELSMLGRKSVDPCWVSDQHEETALYSSLIYFRGNETQK